MARKRRKASAGKRRKKSRTAAIRKTARAGVKKRRYRRRAQTLGDKISGAYRTVVDTIKGTDQLRNKLEPPASSETE
jgi:transposase